MRVAGLISTRASGTENPLLIVPAGCWQRADTAASRSALDRLRMLGANSRVDVPLVDSSKGFAEMDVVGADCVLLLVIRKAYFLTWQL